MAQLSDYLLPILVGAAVLFALFKGVASFDVFGGGAKEGFETTIKLLPTLVGLITAVEMFKASGGLDVLVHALSPVARALGLPQEVMPLALLRPISGGGSLAILESIFQDNAPDSFAGRVASVMMGSTETTFYAVAAYFGAVGVKQIRYTVPAALTAELVGFVMSALTVRLLFGV